MRKKWLIGAVSSLLALTFALSGCGKTGTESGTSSGTGENKEYQADQQYLYGVCYVDTQMSTRVKVSEAVSLIGALGAKSVRSWNHSQATMSDYKTIDPNKASRLHELYSALKLQGIDQIIAVNHFWYLPDNPAVATIQVPARDMTEGSEYRKFLEMYQVMWKTLAAEFSEIKYWEMGNEHNHDPFINPKGYTDGSNGVKPFTLEEKADITTDMMFYASKGIKEGNPEAMTIMPAMAPSDGMDGVAMTDYLERIYQNIESGNFGSTNTNDFFEALAWHPYSPFNCPDQAWVDANNRLHDIAKKHGDGSKKVFLTEVGFPDGKNERTDETQAEWVKTMYQLVKEQMPYVESVHYYRMFNDGDNDLYGLFNEPKDGFSVKAKGKAFQEAAGGTGDLNKYVIDPDSYKPGDNVAIRLPVTASSSCEHVPWGWSKGGINDGDKATQGWSNYYELGEKPWVTSPNGGGANSPDTEEWIAFAFPKEWKINKVLVYTRNAINPQTNKIQGIPRQIDVEVSDDGENWKKVATYNVKESDLKVYKQGETVEQMVLEIPFDAVTTKNVRLRFPKLDPDSADAGTNYYVQLMEAEIIMAE